MSKDLQQLLHDALLNNSYDYGPMHSTIVHTWKNSFSYLYNLQRDYIQYEEMFFYSNDSTSHNNKLIGKLYLDQHIYANFNVDYDLIHVFEREEFKLSKFYNNEFTIQDIADNPKIFLKMPILIIDDQVIWDYKIKVYKEYTNFILPFRRNFVLKDERNEETDEVIYQDHKIQVLVVDNIMYQRLTLNKSNTNFSATTNTITLFKRNLKEIPTKNGIMMCSIHLPNNAGKDYELGSTLLPMVEYSDRYEAVVSNDENVAIHNYSKDFYVSAIFVNQLYRHTFYDGKNYTEKKDGVGPWLPVIESSNLVPYKTPIPIENFMVFKKSASNADAGYILQKNTDMLYLHYPNIYTWKDGNINNGDSYEVFYFYHNFEDVKYTVLFDFYFEFLLDTFSGKNLEEVINKIYFKRTAYPSDWSDDTIKKFTDSFNKILSYQYFHHQYGETDFLHRYLPIPGNEDKEPIEYKDETLKEWIKIQPWVLRDYVLEQNKLGASYHLFTNTIDLSERYRTDTTPEFGPSGYKFDEPRYVFAFSNTKMSPVMLNCRAFVDGLMVVDLYQERNLFTDYLYIPTDMVTEDSYIEVEIFPSYEFKENIMFHSPDEQIEIQIAEPDEEIFPTIADIYYEDQNDPVPNRYSPDFFDITSHYERGSFEVKSEDPEKPIRFTRLKSFSIKTNNPEIVGIPLTLNLAKKAQGLEVLIDKPGVPYLEIIEKGFNFNVEYLRIYRNGRLLPRTKYKFLSTFRCPRVMLLDYYEAGELIYIDVAPYRYKQIYYQEELQPSQTLIDLRGIITKPFDIRYYDVYLNGRKLSLNNVFSITPWELTLTNLHSVYNLVIFEKERDWEYFGLNYKEHLYYFNFDDLINSDYCSESEKNELIKRRIDADKDPRLNIKPNENTEEKQDWEDNGKYFEVNIFYYYELMPKTFVNPDRKQFTREIMVNDYPEVYKNYRTSSVNAARDDIEKARKNSYPEVICLDPDIVMKGEDNQCIVYCVGHIDEENAKEYIDQEITVNNQPNI